MNDPILLKKYSNRRLYDTYNSKYVTLGEVSKLIEQGYDVYVEDANTKEDVTELILTQIIMEKAKNKNALLPSSLLHLAIRYGDNILSEFFQKFLLQTVQSYMHSRASFDEQFKKWLDFGFNFSELGQKAFTNLNPFRPFYEYYRSEYTDNKSDNEANSHNNDENQAN